ILIELPGVQPSCLHYSQCYFSLWTSDTTSSLLRDLCLCVCAFPRYLGPHIDPDFPDCRTALAVESRGPDYQIGLDHPGCPIAHLAVASGPDCHTGLDPPHCCIAHLAVASRDPGCHIDLDHPGCHIAHLAAARGPGCHTGLDRPGSRTALAVANRDPGCPGSHTVRLAAVNRGPVDS